MPAKWRMIDQSRVALAHDRLTCERGIAVPMLGLFIVALCAMAGLAIDGGRLYWTKRRLQNAADAAAFAAALELQRGHHDYATYLRPAAVRDSGLNGYPEADTSITVNNPPLSGPKAGNNRFVEVILTRTVPMTFTSVVRSQPIRMRARSVAGRVSYADFCMVALDRTAPAALRVRGTADIFANCGLMSNSSSGSGLQAEGDVDVTATWLGSAGGYNQMGAARISPAPDTNVPPELDPLAYLQPPNYSGWPAASYNAATQTYVCPGGQCVFSSRLEIAGPSGRNITFQPGTYVLRNGIDVSSTNSITGHGVTFYNTGPGNIRLAGETSVTLTAPTTGPFKGILFYVDRNAPSGVLNEFGRGSASFNFRGTIYAPSQALSIEGGFSGGSPWGMIVGRTIDFAGQSNTTLSRPPEAEGPDITKVMLVE